MAGVVGWLGGQIEPEALHLRICTNTEALVGTRKLTWELLESEVSPDQGVLSNDWSKDRLKFVEGVCEGHNYRDHEDLYKQQDSSSRM